MFTLNLPQKTVYPEIDKNEKDEVRSRPLEKIWNQGRCSGFSSTLIKYVTIEKKLDFDSPPSGRISPL